MASNVRQNRTLEAYCCLRGLENEVTSDFCLAPFISLNYSPKNCICAPMTRLRAGISPLTRNALNGKVAR